MPTNLKPKDIRVGLVINHLGTVYEIIKVKYRDHATGKTPDTVRVMNSETGQIVGWYKVKLILQHGKKVEG